MISCPSCHQTVQIFEQHFGTLFTCPHCAAVYFVDWNGQPELPSHEAEQQFEQSVLPTPDMNFSDEAMIQEGTFQVGEEFPTYTSDQVESSAQVDSTESIDVVDPESSIDNAYNFEQPLGQISDESSQTEPNFSDVTDFANSVSDVGLLSYTVTISGLDSGPVIKEFTEVTSDSRFNLDSSNLAEQIVNGQLVIAGLSSTKASLLINRIKYLPLKISWRQDVLTSS